MITIAQFDMECLSHWQSYNLFPCQIHYSLLKLHERMTEPAGLLRCVFYLQAKCVCWAGGEACGPDAAVCPGLHTDG